jgi:hypothetical protein
MPCDTDRVKNANPDLQAAIRLVGLFAQIFMKPHRPRYSRNPLYGAEITSPHLHGC